MTVLSPITFILLVIAVVASFVEASTLYGAPFFVLALFNEGLIAWAARAATDEREF